MMSVYACPLFCICLSPIRIILTWPVILIYLSYFTAAAPGGATTTGIKCSYPFFSSIRISPDFSLLSKLNTAEKSIPHFIRDPCSWFTLPLTSSCTVRIDSLRYFISLLLIFAPLFYLSVQDLLCVESYVLMCPFYYSNYQSILFCVQSVIKFQSHNDVHCSVFAYPPFV